MTTSIVKPHRVSLSPSSWPCDGVSSPPWTSVWGGRPALRLPSCRAYIDDYDSRPFLRKTRTVDSLSALSLCRSWEQSEELESADCGTTHCFPFLSVGLTSGPHGLSESALLDRLEWSSAFAPSTILGTRIIGHCVSARRQIHRIGP